MLLATSAWVVAVLARLLLFGPVLNLAAGTSVFSVGQTTASDRALRWLSNKMGMAPEHLRLLLWLVSLVSAISLLLLLQSLNRIYGVTIGLNRSLFRGLIR